MNWGEIPQEMLDASEQVRKAQENLEKLIQAEVNRRCYAWRMKVAMILRERESLRAGLEAVESFVNCPQETKTALEILRADDAGWFPGTTPREYVDTLYKDS
jgi:hypothetical protein